MHYNLEILVTTVLVLFVIWQLYVVGAYGQSNTTFGSSLPANDSAFAYHNLYSRGEIGVRFNITGNISDAKTPEPGSSSILVDHIGDPKKPVIVNYAFAADWNSTDLINKGDCLWITGKSGIPYMNKSKLYADSIKEIQCKDLPLTIHLPNKPSYPNSTDSSVSKQTSKLNYTNNFMGIEFEYPSTWYKLGYTDIDNKNCKKLEVSCLLKMQRDVDNTSQFAGLDFIALRGPEFKTMCNCNTLKDFIRLRYNELAQNESLDLTFINDNRTLFKDKPIWQMEYSELNSGITIHSWETYAIVNGTYYIIWFHDDEDSYHRFFPEMKSIFDSIEFIPVIQPKVPSFMQ